MTGRGQEWTSGAGKALFLDLGSSYVGVVSGDGPPRKISPPGRFTSQLRICSLKDRDVNNLADNRARNPETFNEKPEKIFPDVLTLKKVCGVVTEIAKRPP